MFVTDLAYDPRSRVLTVRWSTPSRNARAAYEFRDVAPELAAELEHARPHVGRLIADRVVPAHPVRRVGRTAWEVPDATGPDAAA